MGSHLIKGRRRKGVATGLLGPDALDVGARWVRTRDSISATFAVTGYPREVGGGWLSPLLSYPGPVELSLHIEPTSGGSAAQSLRRQMARLESTRRIDQSKLRIPDPQLEAAASDAQRLAAEVARGESRLFKVALYLTIRGHTEDEVEVESAKLRALASSMLLDCRFLTYRSLEAWRSSLPLANDEIRLTRTFDTRALAACFPFATAELNHEGTTLFGVNSATGSLVFCDRFALENHNQVVLARSGAGKSYFAKLTLLRSLYEGIDVLVIDPEDEYGALAASVGGKVISLGSEGVHLNPFDLAKPGQAEALTEQCLFVHTLVQTLIGELSSSEKSTLDRALLDSYDAAGITGDPRTHARPAPLLNHLVDALNESSQGRDLAARLSPFATGSHKRIFEGATTVRPEGHLVVFSLKHLPDELKAAGSLMALDSIWKTVASGPRRRRNVVVDEAWWLLAAGNRHSALFLHRLAKSARKNWCGLTTITQDVQDVLNSELGRSVVTNASSQFLLGQSPQAISGLSEVFNLSRGEAAFLTACERGTGLLFVGNERIPLHVKASQEEHRLVSSSPAEWVENQVVS